MTKDLLVIDSTRGALNRKTVWEPRLVGSGGTIHAVERLAIGLPVPLVQPMIWDTSRQIPIRNQFRISRQGRVIRKKARMMADPQESPISEPRGAENQRVAKRESTFLAAKVAHAGRMFEGRIRNISATGAYLEADADLHSGDRISLSFRGFEDIDAIITRQTTRGVGVHFDVPIDPVQCKRSQMLPSQPAHFEPIRHVGPAIVPKRPARPRLFGPQASGGTR